MDENRSPKLRRSLGNVVSGLILIVAGALFLMQTLGYWKAPALNFWAMAFAGMSLVSLVAFFLEGKMGWGWLFPASIFAGLTGVMLLSNSETGAPLIPGIVLGSVALPFVVRFVMDRGRSWWALIPAWTLTAVGALTVLGEFTQGAWVAAFVLWAIALPFLVVFVVNRRARWALIPAAVLGVVGVIPAITSFFRPELAGSLVLLAVAVPFLVVAIWRPRNWWAIIPFGVLATIAVSIVLGSVLSEPTKGVVISAEIFAGWALTFLVLYLRRKTEATDWAKYPAGGLAGLALLSAFFSSIGAGGAERFFGPALVLLTGFVVLYTALRKK